ncbi:ALQxL family class IV lanthipeptide [Streptosporangium sp. NPDC002544]
MELDVQALDMLPAQAESPLLPCYSTCSPWSLVYDVVTYTSQF